MRFHLIDRIDEWEASARVRARKLTSVTEPHWVEGPDGPVMPRSLVLESLCQAGTWLIMLSTDTRRRAALLSVGDTTWAGDVGPGQEIVLDGTVDSISEEMAVISGTASVDGQVIMTATDVMCALIAAEELEDLDATRAMQAQLDRSAS